MQSQQPLLAFDETERQTGERLLKLAKEIDRAEGYEQPHAVVVARWTERLGERLGLHGVDLSALKFAALTHDLGERTMKRKYLARAGALTWEETLDLWRHPIIGEQAATDLRLPRLTQLLIRWHHEWWNGLGYPDGLAGRAIPLGARILRVADSYCALTAERPHRRAMDAETAEQYLADQAGFEFDPQVAKLFLALLAEERRAQIVEAWPFASPSPDAEVEAAAPVSWYEPPPDDAPPIEQPSLFAESADEAELIEQGVEAQAWWPAPAPQWLEESADAPSPETLIAETPVAEADEPAIEPQDDPENVP